MDHSSSNYNEKANGNCHDAMDVDGGRENASNGDGDTPRENDGGVIYAGGLGPDSARHFNGIDDSKPPARCRPDEMPANDQEYHNGHHEYTHTDDIPHGRADFATASISQNMGQFGRSFDHGNSNRLPDLYRKPPPCNSADDTQQFSRGRQRHRTTIDDVPPSGGFDVPLRFVHVPTNASALDSTKRAPSVPDLISYLHTQQSYLHNQRGHPLLSDETLRDKERESRKEQFEERLRRAHLRLNSDASSSVTRYRSKSTPSRGMWAHGSQGVDRIGSGVSQHACVGEARGESNVVHANARPFEMSGGTLDTAGMPQTKGFHTLSSVDPNDINFGSSPPPELIIAASDDVPGHGISPIAATNAVNSSVRSSDGSRRPRTLSGISSEEHAVLEPPPPPPPATEKERLVERERQARLEAERARRRHLALQRERQLEESGDSAENESGDNAGLPGQISFDEGLQSAPEFVGDSAMLLDSAAGSSVGSSTNIHIPRPPLPPPPATERERLVERERQARLETERARRRHLALLRERQLEESSDDVENEGSENAGLLGQVSFDAGLEITPEFVGGIASSVESIPRPPLPPPPATERERLVERERQARLESERARMRHRAVRQLEDDNLEGMIHTDVDSQPSERQASFQGSQLHEAPPDDQGEEEANINLASPSDVDHTIHQPEMQNTEAEASLSYPMERFLERVDDEEPLLPLDTPSPANDDSAELPYTMELFLAESAVVGPSGDADSGNERTLEPIVPASQIQQTNSVDVDSPHDSLAAQPDLPRTNLSEIASPPNDLTGSVNELGSSSVSIASIIASADQEALDAHIDDDPVDNMPDANSDLLPSHDSFDTNPHPPRLTEAEIAQLAEVEHASTGNAAPQSVRDEPSDASFIGRGTFDHAFSVATQTTMMESATAASEGPPESTFSNINESGESLNIVRIDSNGSIQTSTSEDASSASGDTVASITAMPSSASSDSSNDSDDISHQHSEMSESLSNSSLAQDPLHTSDNIMPRLTEADIVTMAEIDSASIIGNAPPQSVRDERLSESSVTERLERQFSLTTPITEISSVDEQISAGDLLMVGDSDVDVSLSVEAIPGRHSSQSIEMHLHDSDEEVFVYQDSMGSSASIEALPSVDLEADGGLYHYGAIDSSAQLNHSTGEFSMDIDVSCDRDIESAPLLSLNPEGRAQAPIETSTPEACNRTRYKSSPNESSASNIPLLIGFAAGFTVGFVVCWVNWQMQG